ILSRLKKGERMDRPEGCSDDLSVESSRNNATVSSFCTLSRPLGRRESNTQCWAKIPSERSNFSILRIRMAILLEQ
ncbi:hypothetical protein PRIPAC_89060, partial [Pristionchus pacificus]|uniref:Uncharacterized protein n=1 Tax=Pristionchus pacificus TaxID=54126 RepID=A0A2A6CWQ0_PRIPA